MKKTFEHFIKSKEISPKNANQSFVLLTKNEILYAFELYKKRTEIVENIDFKGLRNKKNLKEYKKNK